MQIIQVFYGGPVMLIITPLPHFNNFLKEKVKEIFLRREGSLMGKEWSIIGGRFQGF